MEKIEEVTVKRAACMCRSGKMDNQHPMAIKHAHSTLTLSNISLVVSLQRWMLKSVLEHRQTNCPVIIPSTI